MRSGLGQSRESLRQGPGRGRAKASDARAALEARRRLGRELRELRSRRGMTQRALSARSGVQQAEISRIEAGSSNPTLSTLAHLAHALDAAVSVSSVGAVPARPSLRGAGAARRTRFLCLVCAETLMEGMARREAERHLAEYRGFTERLRNRGQLVACDRLLPAETAATVRVRKGKVSVTDGPFAETKELVGGYFVIEARGMTEAVRVASAIPGAKVGCVEVRPIADDRATLRALGRAASTTAG